MVQNGNEMTLESVTFYKDRYISLKSDNITQKPQVYFQILG